MNQAENLKGGTVVRWVAIIAAAIIIGGVVAGNLSSYVLRTKPAAREQIATIPEKWEFTATGAITGALAFGDDRTLYAASEDGFVYALDSSGSLQWKFNTGPMLAGPTIGADGTIYVSNKDESIYAINRTAPCSGQWRAARMLTSP
jgi:outer membrane protein assembly factor BamB